jgi:hypothetical protein
MLNNLSRILGEGEDGSQVFCIVSHLQKSLIRRNHIIKGMGLEDQK